MQNPGKDNLSISLLVPCYNEQEALLQSYQRIKKSIEILPYKFEIVFVDDGSKDDTWNIIKKIAAGDKAVKALLLSRNFGKEAAMSAGLRECTGDAVIILDADLQDPPELISALVDIWLSEKADVVYGQRRTRTGDTWMKRATAAAFYKTIRFVSDVDIPENTGDFRLMNRRATDAVLQLGEKHRFMKGLFAWIGYKQVAFHYDREARIAGTTKLNYRKLMHLAMEGITGFSTTPLRIATLVGFLVSLFAFMFGGWIILKTLMDGRDVPGYASLMVVVSFLSGVQLLSIGIMGEYIGRIFGETKNRSLYFIQEKIDAEQK